MWWVTPNVNFASSRNHWFYCIYNSLFLSRICTLYRNRNFCEETKFAKLLWELKCPFGAIKKPTSFSLCLQPLFVVFWVLRWRTNVDGCFLFVTYIIDLSMRTPSKLSTGSSCLCSTSERAVTVFSFLRFLLPYFWHASQSIGQPSVLNNRRRKHTHTHQPLTMIPFKVRLNSSNCLPLPAYNKIFDEFSFLYIFNSLA